MICNHLGKLNVIWYIAIWSKLTPTDHQKICRGYLFAFCVSNLFIRRGDHIRASSAVRPRASGERPYKIISNFLMRSPRFCAAFLFLCLWIVAVPLSRSLDGIHSFRWVVSPGRRSPYWPIWRSKKAAISAIKAISWFPSASLITSWSRSS